MPEKMEEITARSVDQPDAEMGEDLDHAGLWVPVALQLALSKSDRGKRSC